MRSGNGRGSYNKKRLRESLTITGTKDAEVLDTPRN